MDAFIAHHLHGVSRTYALLVPMLPAPLDDAVGLAYLLMRIVDTLEDAPQLSTADRCRLLDILEQALDDDALCNDPQRAAALVVPAGELAAERELMQAAPEVLARVARLDPEYRAAIAACARAMGHGVRTLIDRSAQRGQPYPAVADECELREYCYYVAGTVGEMLCAMMAHYLRSPALLRMRELAVELGVGLQLVNILKDAFKDAHHGRRYLPGADDAGARREIYRAVLAEARQSLQKGIDYVLGLPAMARELRSFCGLPIAWGAMTLAKAEMNARAAKIDRSAIAGSIAAFQRLADKDADLRNWLSGLVNQGAAPSPG